jgi:preprotein translocase subunit SecB
MSDNEQQQADGPEFGLQRIYTKDISFETPNSPSIFNEKWNPDSNLNLSSEVHPQENDLFEVVLTVTLTTKVADKTAYLIEVTQAGIFLAKGFPQKEMGPMMGAYCPNILFPYVREVISDLIAKGSFPQLLLSPVNFDSLYAQHMQQLQAQANAQKEAEGEGAH